MTRHSCNPHCWNGWCRLGQAERPPCPGSRAYRRPCRQPTRVAACPTIERLLAHGRPGLRDLLLLTDVAYLDTDEIIKIDPDLLSFFNVNSEADLQRAKRLLEIGGGP